MRMRLNNPSEQWYPFAGPGKNHMVYIEKLTPDLRHAANQSVFGPFPDQFVEGKTTRQTLLHLVTLHYGL